ncbi:aldehyde dehydrogenase family protein [Rhizobium paranaense]|uniref:Acyl-CoA reductase-like NAD-dependent aldehyde dehydrogenase n=1 Tax=Rhizobium paranaense TaxID=1650438 RepID=A0A7W8XZ24_9HYPH|nr:aldehyde dehydrogenase family protein [Rhizobium paranaense]MBB5577995.1 acyl-CoA reductase-like NAD-dependent aldehyde dehydrogenase [Rhizobium paranaense]
MTKYKMLIGGRLMTGAGEMPVIDPSTAEIFTTAPYASATQLEDAVRAAKDAFPDWAATPLETRRACLLRLADRLEQEADDFARLLTREQGKPLPEATYEVGATIRGIRYFATYEAAPEKRDHARGEYELHRVPLGVVACVTPWNFPMLLASNKFGAALITGNTVILKPAPTTPLTSLELGRLAEGIFPPGVFNVICDRNDLGATLTAHADVAKVSFTGSTATGKKVMASAAGTLKRVTLELGGNDAAIVLDDVDIDQMVPRLVMAAFLNAGQVCVAAKRLYVAESIYDDFAAKYATAVRNLKLGCGLDEGVEIGPLQNVDQFEKVKEYLAIAESDGTVIAGGRVDNRPGYFVEPTVVRDITDGSRLVDEEQFGPVVPLISFTDDDDAIRRANASLFGLGASIWSSNLTRARALAMKLEVGNVWINQHQALAADIPFPGAKESGSGVEAGPEGFLEFTRVQILNVA